MFVIDDLAFAPFKGFMWLVRELHGAAEREFSDERERTMRALQSLHMQLEAGQLDDDAFDIEEARLLDRLDELDGMLTTSEEADAGDDGPMEDGDSSTAERPERNVS